MGCPYENNSISFFWDGCEVDEADDRALSMIVKDGDTLTLVSYSHIVLITPEYNLVSCPEASSPSFEPQDSQVQMVMDNTIHGKVWS